MADVSRDILRAFVREALVTLTERAHDPASAQARGLALMAPSDGLGMYVLYDQDKVVTTALEMPGERAGDVAKAFVAAGAVVGIIYTEKSRHCWDARAATLSAAERGYGPLMHDIAMADGPLAPDRQAVSSSEEKLWRYYHDSRPDVEKEPIGRGCTKHVKSRPWLNFVYTLRGSVDVAALRARHDETLAELSYDFSHADVESALSSAADRYFDSRYREA